MPLTQAKSPSTPRVFALSSTREMPKTAGAVPKGWGVHTTYLYAPSYSKKLNSDKVSALIFQKAHLGPNAQVYKTSGPYTNVKITPVSDAAHPAHGQHALYANQQLSPDSFILPYLGFVHDQADLNPASDYDLSLDRELGIGVDASTMGNEARFINDYRGVSTAPNAEFRDIYVDIGNGKVEKRVGVFVLSAGKSGKRAKGIGRGQEILVSYGKGFWTERQATEE
ncbi:hypothetical protein PTT_14681 [Pyrenophora teres f. teres 0-1]|uniref:SET domain-containing protein n=1 Tax=Pyrenophora teres f. teres (strain 0-1) TaxID=861557 RepID=E3RYP0_PYRTT|nr:hypothetical protein PTT_14681 [Pyrenophora teres f. teres 0-1]